MNELKPGQEGTSQHQCIACIALSEARAEAWMASHALRKRKTKALSRSSKIPAVFRRKFTGNPWKLRYLGSWIHIIRGCRLSLWVLVIERGQIDRDSKEYSTHLDALLNCSTHCNWEPNFCQTSVMKKLMRRYSVLPALLLLSPGAQSGYWSCPLITYSQRFQVGCSSAKSHIAQIYQIWVWKLRGKKTELMADHHYSHESCHKLPASSKWKQLRHLSTFHGGGALHVLRDPDLRQRR